MYKNFCILFLIRRLLFGRVLQFQFVRLKHFCHILVYFFMCSLCSENPFHICFGFAGPDVASAGHHGGLCTHVARPPSQPLCISTSKLPHPNPGFHHFGHGGHSLQTPAGAPADGQISPFALHLLWSSCFFRGGAGLFRTTVV